MVSRVFRPHPNMTGNDTFLGPHYFAGSGGAACKRARQRPATDNSTVPRPDQTGPFFPSPAGHAAPPSSTPHLHIARTTGRKVSPCGVSRYSTFGGTCG